MKMTVKGNNIIEFAANEDITTITLPAGYSYNRVHITEVTNFYDFNLAGAYNNTVYYFPPINSKSPCTVKLSRLDPNKETRIRITIEKFGEIPDVNYFGAPFDPILVTDKDDKEYNVIQSDQFK